MNLGIASLIQAYSNRELTCKQVIEYCLENINKYSQDYNVLISYRETKELLDIADQVDQKISSGEKLLPLEGIPFISKDIFLDKFLPTTAASKGLENYKASFNATAIEKLLSAGAILLGKANLDEFAQGGTGENSAFGPTKNAWDKERVAGGSSSGSAVAVAKDMASFALGTDTGGSIRNPASYNGLFGFKPSYGAISRYGVISMASSLDTVSVIASNSLDVKMVMETLKGKDQNDFTSFSLDSKRVFVTPKVALIKEYYDPLGEKQKAVIDKAVKTLKDQDIYVDQISIEELALALPAYYIITPAEVSANMSRHDGILYGHRTKDYQGLDDYYAKTRDEGFGLEVKRRVMIGSYVLSQGHKDAYYYQALKVRGLLSQRFKQIFTQYDVLLGATTVDIAPKMGESLDPVKAYQADIMTVASNIVGLPSLSMDMGRIDNMPYGLQLISAQEQDYALLDFCKYLEKQKDGD